MQSQQLWKSGKNEVGKSGKNECSHNNCGDEWIGQARALAGTSGLNEKVGCEMAAREAKQCQR